MKRIATLIVAALTLFACGNDPSYKGGVPKDGTDPEEGQEAITEEVKVPEEYANYTRVALKSSITKVQPMTGIVMWAPYKSDDISLEYSYMQYNDICKEKDIYGRIGDVFGFDILSDFKTKGMIEGGDRCYSIEDKRRMLSLYTELGKKYGVRFFNADNLIDFDPTEEIEGIKWDHTCKRERLTSKEIEAIKHTPFKDEEVKKAVRFDIACGLRRADLLALRWENLEREKRRYYMCITIKKTGNKVRIPLSKEAVSILRPIRKKGAVFPTLSPYILNHKVPLLIEAAGIDKHITFHCSESTNISPSTASGILSLCSCWTKVSISRLLPSSWDISSWAVP